jgi:hypothetical protein
MQYINSFFQLYARDGVYAEKAGAFFCHLLGFEHGCSYFAATGVVESEFKNATNICEQSRRALLRYRFC